VLRGGCIKVGNWKGPSMTNAIGRPPKQEKAVRYYDTALHHLLAKRLPSNLVRDDRVNVTALAAAIGRHKFTVYKWLEANRLPSKKAVEAVLEVTKSTRKPLTKEELLRFILA
jgi:hypothetical protein